MLIVKLAFRNAARNLRRTLLTAATVVFSVALLVLAMSWIQGIFGGAIETSAASIGHVRVVDPDFAAREQLMPLYEHIAPVGPVLEAVRGVPGVVGAYPVLRAGVAVSAGDELGDSFGMVVGAPVAWFADRLDLDAHIVEGGFFTGAADELVLGRKLADKAGARVGDDVLLMGQTQDGSLSAIEGRLVGVVAAGHGMVDRQAFVPLAKAQWLTDIEDGALEVLVYGARYDGADALDAALTAVPALEGFAVQAYTERPPFDALLGITDVIQGMLAAVFVFVAALAIWNTMMMSVLERTSEIGVLRAMGLTPLGTVALFVLEAMLIATAGAAVGIAIGLVPALLLQRYGFTLGDQVLERMGDGFAMTTTVYAEVTPGIVLDGFLIGLLMAFFGSLVPSLHAAAVQPVDAMRTGR